LGHPVVTCPTSPMLLHRLHLRISCHRHTAMPPWLMRFIAPSCRDAAIAGQTLQKLVMTRRSGRNSIGLLIKRFPGVKSSAALWSAAQSRSFPVWTRFKSSRDRAAAINCCHWTEVSGRAVLPASCTPPGECAANYTRSH